MPLNTSIRIHFHFVHKTFPLCNHVITALGAILKNLQIRENITIFGFYGSIMSILDRLDAYNKNAEYRSDVERFRDYQSVAYDHRNVLHYSRIGVTVSFTFKLHFSCY